MTSDMTFDWTECTGNSSCKQFERAWLLRMPTVRRFNIVVAELDGKWFIDDTQQAAYVFREMEGVNSLKEAQAIAETIGRLEDT